MARYGTTTGEFAQQSPDPSEAEDEAVDLKMCNMRDNLIIENRAVSIPYFPPTAFKVNYLKFRPIHRRGTREGTTAKAPHSN